MPWRPDRPSAISRQRVTGWWSSSTPPPPPPPPQGWLPGVTGASYAEGTLRADVDALLATILSGQGALSASVAEFQNIEDEYFRAVGKLSASAVGDKPFFDGLFANTLAGGVAGKPGGVGTLGALIFIIQNSTAQLAGAGALSATRYPKMNAGAAVLSSVGSLAAAADFPATGPVTTAYTATGAFAYTVPYWAKYLDVVVIGGGGSGRGLPIIGAWGNGGQAGTWGGVTLQRGVNVPWNTLSITGTVGTGGARNGTNDGLPGGASSATITGYGTVSGSGGAGGSGTLSHVDGYNASDFVLAGVTYNGGNGGNAGSGTGSQPGGGGGGATVSLQAGGAGGAGQVWIRAYQ